MNTKIFGAVLSVLVITTVCLACMSTMFSFTSAANVTDVNTSSDANVSYYIAIGMSTELTNGIHFGVVEQNTNNNNASQNANNNNASQNVMAGNTLYYVSVSADGNTNVNISTKDSAALTSSGNTIGNGNYTYNANVNATNPVLPGTAMTLNFAQAIGNIAPGSNAFFRFWLDIPSAQPAGNYANTVFFQAIRAEE